MNGEVSRNSFIEFRGYKGQRIAIGAYASFMVSEITDQMPATVGNDRVTSGCFVYIGHLPPFITLDFYPNVIAKICEVGRQMESIEKILSKLNDSPDQDHKPTTASLAE